MRQLEGWVAGSWGLTSGMLDPVGRTEFGRVGMGWCEFFVWCGGYSKKTG